MTNPKTTQVITEDELTDMFGEGGKEEVKENYTSIKEISKPKGQLKRMIVDPDLDDRDLEDYYILNGYCSNCRHSGSFTDGVDVLIPEGMKKPTGQLKCPNCKTLSMTLA